MFRDDLASACGACATSRPTCYQRDSSDARPGGIGNSGGAEGEPLDRRQEPRNELGGTNGALLYAVLAPGGTMAKNTRFYTSRSMPYDGRRGQECDANRATRPHQGELARSATLGRMQFGDVLRLGGDTYVPIAHLGVGLQGAPRSKTLTPATGEYPGPDSFEWTMLATIGTGLDPVTYLRAPANASGSRCPPETIAVRIRRGQGEQPYAVIMQRPACPVLTR